MNETKPKRIRIRDLETKREQDRRSYHKKKAELELYNENLPELEKKVLNTRHNVCEHNKEKRKCVDCSPHNFCEHGKRKDRCKTCGGSYYCSHGKQKRICIECNGHDLCEHLKDKFICNFCNPQYGLVTRLTRIIKTALKSKTVKLDREIEHLGCTVGELKHYFQSKMTEELTFNNFSLDHIKPIHSFNLDDPVQFSQCCHFSNLQPLTKKQNQLKGMCWKLADEIFWLENICGTYYPNLYLLSRN
jgi:hypothetical protein